MNLRRSKAPIVFDGDGYTAAPSSTCPKCGHHLITRDNSTVATFSERGWYYPITLTCNNPKCGNKWVEQQIVVQNNEYLM